MSGHATRGSTTRASTKRTKVDLIGGGTNVQIKEQRRFFSSRGNSGPIREAQAIADAFSVGLEFAVDEVRRSDVRGEERAVETAGAGGERDPDDKNSGYNKAWDLLDDERSLNLATTELPQLLQEMDAENKPEKQVQDFISAYMKDQFDGIDTENEDHKFLAAGLLALEANLIEEHRDNVIEQISEQQRTDLFENARDRYDRDKVIPYEYIGEQTNVFFDGAEKRVVYWEMIYDIAIENGDPDAIRNVPERFASGDPTGINDPKMADAHRAAIRSATIKQASTALAVFQAQEDENDGVRFGLQMKMWDTRIAGGDINPLIKVMSTIPGTELSDITSATNFGDSQLEERDTRSANLEVGVQLWDSVYKGNLNPSDVFDAYTTGLLGTGPQAKEEAKKLLSTINSVKNAGASHNSKDVTAWRTQINNRYNARTGGLFEGINPVMARINIDANAMYLTETQRGTPASAAAQLVFEKFDPMVDSLPSLSKEELEGRRSQASFTGSTSVSLNVISNVLEGNISVREAFTGVPNFVVRDRLMDELDLGSITEAEALSIAQQL